MKLHRLGYVYQNKQGEFISLWQVLGSDGSRSLSVQTDLCIQYDDLCAMPDPEMPWDIAINALTSLILCQASAGIDVLSDAYKRGIDNTIDILADRYGDE